MTLWTDIPHNKPGPHTGRNHRTCLDIRQLINTVEYPSIYSKDYLQSCHTHIPVSELRNQRVLTVCMAAGGIKGLIGASLSEPHTSVTAFAEVVCMSVCLSAAIYRKF